MVITEGYISIRNEIREEIINQIAENDLDFLNKIIKIFKSWKIIPIYLLMIFLGNLFEFFRFNILLILISLSLFLSFFFVIFCLPIFGLFKDSLLKNLDVFVESMYTIWGLDKVKANKKKFIFYGSKFYFENIKYKLKINKKLKIFEFLISIILLIFPFMMEVFFVFTWPQMSIIKLACVSLINFFSSLSIVSAFFKDYENFSLIKHADYDFTLANLMMISLVCFFNGFSLLILTDIINRTYLIAFLHFISKNFNIFFNTSLTLILVSATLSLLAFTYYLVIKDYENLDNKFFIKLSGEDYFKSSILFIISLVFITLTSFLLNIYPFFRNFNDIININNYVISYFFVCLSLCIILSLYYGIFYLRYGLKYSQKVLRISWSLN